jgi:hypothetical protein
VNQVQQKRIIGFKLYSLMLVLQLSLVILAMLYCKKYIVCAGFSVALSSAIIPASQYILQIISELYGFDHGRQQVWLSTIVRMLLLIVVFLGVIYSNLNPSNDGPNNYFEVIGSWQDFIVISLSLLLLVIIEFLLVKYACKLKSYWHGKKLVLRLIMLQLVVELLFLMMSSLIVSCYYQYNLSLHLTLLLNNIIFSSVVSVLLMPFMISACNFIKYREGYAVYDINQDYKIFAFKINFEKMQFKQIQY